MEKVIHFGFVIAFALAGPSLLGLIDSSTSIGESAMWGGLFGVIGGLVGRLVAKFVEKPA